MEQGMRKTAILWSSYVIATVVIISFLSNNYKISLCNDTSWHAMFLQTYTGKVGHTHSDSQRLQK